MGAKLVLILTAVGVAGALAITVLLAAIITPSFNGLEAKAVRGHVERTQAALTDYAAKVESAVRDYGDWNDSYDYMAHPSVWFERESFSSLAMANLGVQGMAYVAPDRHVVIARWIGANGAERPAMRAALIRAIAATDLERALRGGSSGRFFARVGDEVAAIGLARVRRSDGSGSPRGFVLMARAIGSAQLAELLVVPARIERPAGDTDIVSPGRATTQIAVPLRGADGHAVAAARFAVPREVSMLGRRMLLLAIAGSTLLLLIVLLVLRRVIARLVLAPLARVERHMQRVRASGSLSLLEEEGRDDEIGSLGRSFNAMLAQLKDLREQIQVQSFALGRSESAVAVMHNVRNALNPISTILSQGVAQAPPVERATLDRAMAELARDDVPAARRARLTTFVAAAFEAERLARDATRRELQVGREAMTHVLEIIGQQQKSAHERPEVEGVDVAEIVARNAAIARYSQLASIAFSFPAGPHVALANRVILSQVVGNLLGNAAEAIAARGTGSGSIGVTIAEEDGHVVIVIGDDGEGFDADRAPNLFQRGFSTRQHKSGGLGLHWCANSVTAMGGTLALRSAGKGLGAEAVLTLPAAGEALAHAA
ncbi:ATP-binding protein [Sphingomonas rubra]|uniref:ATP-binding protein n=1 Tax=Sphingomonas rubra TaxID=634430 RepID=UPI003183418C